ncbi:MAG: hypothetical protein BWY46_00779 [Firmicutes bacterium ADurb.Bin300]|nr:MAG: hypothetical protein BWY46_00779 [Firmicutes bacterium ADurb.Bin300]
MKKLISYAVAIIMLIATLSPAAFSAENSCDCGQSPIVYISGLGSASLIRDAGSENEQQLWKIDTEYAIKEFATLAPSVAALMATGNYDAFGDDLIAVIKTVFGDLALDGDGVSSDRVTYELREYTSSEHGLDRDYYFAYDFRISPFETAALLKTAVETVKELTGHKKVSFKASSMGGVIAMAYLSAYGTEDIDKIIFINCPILGTEVAGELFTKQLEINKDALIRYGEQALPALDNDPLAAILYAVIEALDISGIWDTLLLTADFFIDKLGEKVLNEAVIPIFTSMPGLWSFVSDLYFEQAKDAVINPETQAGMLSKINDYHYNVQNKAAEILNSARADGVCIYIIAGYDMQRTPLVPSYLNDSDGTVDTKYASVGAVVAPIRETFSDDYTQAVDFDGINYISPDNHIDASTCALPDSTWFIKNMLHCNNHDGHRELYRMMFESDTQLTVFSDPCYLQFLQNDKDNQTFYEVVPNEDYTELDRLLLAPSLLHFVAFISCLLKVFRF